jgi:3-deoxy-D-manno-octulosonate 8-phosphate phosphatase (KDO 8-P phosphatase)
MEEITQDIRDRASRIKLLLMDCDGVLTDGRLYFGDNGDHVKAFHTRDGQGIVAWHEAGYLSGVISGRDSRALADRAKQLGMHHVVQGCRDKATALNEIMSAAGVAADETAFIGDDTPDISAMNSVGLAVAVADASTDAIEAADYVTRRDGGLGAVREVVDLILASRKQTLQKNFPC